MLLDASLPEKFKPATVTPKYESSNERKQTHKGWLLYSAKPSLNAISTTKKPIDQGVQGGSLAIISWFLTPLELVVGPQVIERYK